MFVESVTGTGTQGLVWADYLVDYLHFVITGITIVVVAVPEGLPLAVTLALALSVRRMLSDNNLVRYLGACEIMGSATTICTDKTGTLTQNEHRVMRVWANGTALGWSSEHTASPMSILSSHGMDHAASADPNATWDPSLSDSWDGPLEMDDSRRVERSRYGKPNDYELWGVLAEAICTNSTAQISRPKQNAKSPATTENFGSRTEQALLQFAMDLVESDSSNTSAAQREKCRVERVVPFSPERRRMCSIVRMPPQNEEKVITQGIELARGTYRMYVKGAAKDVLALCASQLAADGVTAEPLQRDALKKIALRWSQEGLRVMIIALKDYEHGFDPCCCDFDIALAEEGLTFVAAVGIENPLRPEVSHAIAQCQTAGITVRMVTGDSLPTAIAVARKCGILPSSPDDTLEEGTAMEGEAFREAVRDPRTGLVDQHAMDKVWPKLRVLARSSPADKFDLVTGIKASHVIGQDKQVVAVTGDGTNDAPALKAADVGFAMGVAGTTVAKDASDILLLDDDFSSAVAAVLWGRNIYESIQKFLQFQLTVNASAVSTAVGCALLIGESPLTAVQMLWLNLIMDSLAGLALATDYPSDELLMRAPVSVDKQIISPRMFTHITSQAVYQLLVMAVLVGYGDVLFDVASCRNMLYDGVKALEATVAEGSLSTAPTCVHYTIVFNTFVLMQLVNQINCRKVNDHSLNVFEGIGVNQMFVSIFIAELVLQVAIVQFGGAVFSTHPLSLHHWAACVAIAMGGLPLRALVTTAFDACTQTAPDDTPVHHYL